MLPIIIVVVFLKVIIFVTSLFTIQLAMKITLIILTLLLSFPCYSQSQTKPVDSLYIVTYTTGTAWDHSKPADQPYFKEHGARLGQLRKDGVIRFGARHGDKGSIVIVAKNLNEAKEIVNADVAVINKLFNADIQRLNIFYEGCLERPK